MYYLSNWARKSSRDDVNTLSLTQTEGNEQLCNAARCVRGLHQKNDQQLGHCFGYVIKKVFSYQFHFSNVCDTRDHVKHLHLPTRVGTKRGRGHAPGQKRRSL